MKKNQSTLRSINTLRIKKLIIFSVICIFTAFIVKTVVENNIDCCSVPVVLNQLNSNSQINKKDNILNSSELASLDDRSLVKLRIADKDFTAELVNTIESRTLGLSGREKIGYINEISKAGNVNAMLFVFPKEQKHVFWMKDMNFDIDIIWIKDGKIVDISRDVPAPDSNTSLNKLPRFSPSEAVDVVLEIVSESGDEMSVGDLVSVN